MERLARSSVFWWVLLVIAAVVILASLVLQVIGGFSNVGGWLTMFGSGCTVLVCILQLRAISHSRSERAE